MSSEIPEMSSETAKMATEKAGLSPELAQKYSAYQKSHEEGYGYNDPSKINLDSPPVLLDALFSGLGHLPYIKTSHSKFTEEIANDVKEIVKQCPSAIHANGASTRVNDRMTPLAVACMNPGVPVDLIEFLLQNGANPDLPIIYNTKKVKIIDHLKIFKMCWGDDHWCGTCNVPSRLDQLTSLLEKYSSKDEGNVYFLKFRYTDEPITIGQYSSYKKAKDAKVRFAFIRTEWVWKLKKEDFWVDRKSGCNLYICSGRVDEDHFDRLGY